MSTLRAADLRGALGVVDALERGDASAPFSTDVLLALQSLFDADLVSYHEGEEGRLEGVRVPDPLPTVRSGVSPYTNPLFRHLKWRHDAARLSDFLSRRAALDNPYCVANLRPLALEYQLAVAFPPKLGSCRLFIFERGGSSDFSERDRELLTLLRPHFVARCRHQERDRRVGELERALRTGAYDWMLADSGDRSGLTSRESEVLHWVREGLTNKEIAIRMAISAATVRKHLENAYAKLGVHTRTGAVRASGNS